MSQQTIRADKRFLQYVWNTKTRGQLIRYFLVGLVATAVTAYFGISIHEFFSLWLLNGVVGLSEFLLRKWWVFRA